MAPLAAASGSDDTEVFVLSRPHGTVRAHGRVASFDDVTSAGDALRSGAVDAIVGAIPFDVAGRAALIAPASLVRSTEPVTGAPAPAHRVVEQTLRPTAVEHRDRVADVVKRIVDGEAEKVVLARSMDLRVEPAVEVPDLLSAFAHGNAEHNAFAVALGAAGWLVGSTPELLLRKEGREVTCRPYAGSAPRSDDPELDRAAADSLAASVKDRAEHAFVVDYLRDRLAPLCADLDVPTEPEVRSTGEIWHLATPIRATLRDETITALDLAVALSPTPAVCGTPSDVAAQIIAEIEGDRGLYGGTVGWCDADGDGEWMVTIRCLELSADGHSLRTWAGGGIVAQSDPQAELDETTAKFRTVRNALGLDDA
ncbi:isochorismate synthase [Gordonia sp. CPCC 206044]|uniref:isochorismate synthase n=1 Tax=Gordonia sp. CPCC 206044 TaxID=3140793 RepID=UPI003AF3B017